MFGAKRSEISAGGTKNKGQAIITEGFAALSALREEMGPSLVCVRYWVLSKQPGQLGFYF